MEPLRRPAQVLEALTSVSDRDSKLLSLDLDIVTNDAVIFGRDIDRGAP
ncbi:MAG: hypothetical protein ACJARS_002720 [bacterium]|jgi:hypothetical protein